MDPTSGPRRLFLAQKNWYRSIIVGIGRFIGQYRCYRQIHRYFGAVASTDFYIGRSLIEMVICKCCIILTFKIYNTYNITGNIVVTCLPPIETKGKTLADIPELMIEVRRKMMDKFTEISSQVKLEKVELENT